MLEPLISLFILISFLSQKEMKAIILEGKNLPGLEFHFAGKFFIFTLLTNYYFNVNFCD